MDLTLNGLMQAVTQTIRDPRSGARIVLSLDLSRRERWEMLLLTVVLSAVLAKISVFLSSGAEEVGIFAASPFALGAVQLVLMLFAVHAIDLVGRKMGGSGELDGAIVLVAWLQFVMICIQVLQIVLLLVLPLLSFLLGVAGLGLFFWMLTQFIMELHGFKSAMSVFTGIFLCLLGFAVVFSILIGLAGVTVPGSS